MSETSMYRQKAKVFDQRADRATDPISGHQYREMAAHCRQLLVEHLAVRASGFAD